MNDYLVINSQHFTGFITGEIITYESKIGVPAIRFQIWVGHAKPNGFYQWIAVYGNRSIELAKTIEDGDLMMVYGKKAFLHFTDRAGRPSHADFCIAAHCYVMTKKGAFQKTE